MGNKQPSEAHGVNCSFCGTRLPPCKSFDGFRDETKDRLVDRIRVYNFLGGRYYRPIGSPYYYCPTCFWKPKNQYLQRQEEERRRREEERRRQEEERRRQQRRQEEERRRELQRQAELRRRQEEARAEAARQERLRQEEQRREEERRRRAQAQQEFEEAEEEKKGLAEKFLEWSLSKDKQNVHKNVQIEAYHDTIALPSGENPEPVKVFDDNKLWTEEDLWEEDIAYEESYEGVDDTEITNKVIAIVNEYHPSAGSIDVEWLKSVQTQLLCHYGRVNSLSTNEMEILCYFLTLVQHKLNDQEIFNLTKIICSVGISHPLDYQKTATQLDDDIPGRFLCMLLNGGYELNLAFSDCMKQCLNTLAISNIAQNDSQLADMIVEARSKLWSAYDRFLFLQKCEEKGLSFTDQKHILHLVQAYDLAPLILKDALEQGHQASDVIDTLLNEIDTEPQMHLDNILDEIRSTKLIEESTVELVEVIVRKVNAILDSFNIHLDYKQRLTEAALLKARTSLRNCPTGSTIDPDSIADTLATFCCAVKQTQGYCPRNTQLVTLTILMVSSNKSISRLLEVMTGEGKSTVISMFAAVLAIQDKHVDIITSSPILAIRDSEEWEAFYEIFDLRTTHNTTLNQGQTSKDALEAQRRDCYKHHIVYGTVSNFAADILREEFEQKEVRCGRRFDAVIADEVDLLMLDEGVQFTYLSHKAAVLHHVEPVLATVWSVIGQYGPATTVHGGTLYIGGPKLFSDTIFESINPDECQVEESSQFLLIAQQAGLIDEMTTEKLMWNDRSSEGLTPEQTEERQDSKREAMSAIRGEAIVALLAKLEEYLPYTFEAYVINSDHVLEPVHVVKPETTSHEGEEKLPEVKILVLENGMACTLSTPEELKDGATAKIKGSLKFSNQLDTEDDKTKAEVKLPLNLKEYVENQLPTYVDSALKCLQMVENREYTINKLGKIIPVDFQNSGITQLNKKWGGGLQQMLEMKHSLSLSPMSVVTNFMSHVELFSRYKENGAIYGLSGTLGLDSPDTAKVLLKLFDVHPCTIPTFKHRKLYEKPAIIVDGGDDEWYAKIMEVINEAVKEEPWKKGRAVLILCEDIKTAVNLKSHVIEEQHWDKEKVYLYARSDSNELNAIKRKFNRGEIVIATNLAGRGTNIKLTDEVNKSGGLLCLVTFLARNRRVELQAFGRTARKGTPGSVQCVIKASSLPLHYQGLDIKAIRRLRSEREELRLDELMNTDVKEVQVRESLFKEHCKYLKRIYEPVEGREDRQVKYDSINESWGQWLQMRSDRIENFELDLLKLELTTLQTTWPRNNFYHHIQLGNILLVSHEEENAGKARECYDSAISLEPRYAAISHYNRAYCTILTEEDGYMDTAMRDLEAAEKCLDPYISETASALQCVSVVNDTRKPSTQAPEESDSETSDKKEFANRFSQQMQVRIQIFGFVRDKIREAINKLKQYKDEGEDVEAEAIGIFSLIPKADYVTNQELYAMWSLGMEVVFSVKKKPRFCWEGLIVAIIGVAQIVAGVALAVLTVGTAASFGMGLITEGISDCIDGVIAMATGEFSWAEWGIAKATGLAVSLVSGGVARFATKGFQAFKIATKLGKQFKAIPKIAKNSWGLAAKANFKNVAKYTGKKVAEQAVIRGLAFGQNKLFEQIVDKIGDKCKDLIISDLQREFRSGEMADLVDRQFVRQVHESYLVEDKMSPAIRKKARDFFNSVGNEVVVTLVADATVKEHVTSASLSLLKHMEYKHKGGKLGYQVLEAAVVTTIVTKVMVDLELLVQKFIPELQHICEEFTKEELRSSSQVDLTRYRNLDCSTILKAELADYLGDVFGDAVATLLQQNLGSVVNHSLHMTVNTVGMRVLNKYLRLDKSLEDIKAGRKANYIRSVDPSQSRYPMTDDSRAVVSRFASTVDDIRTPGSILELKIAVEQFKQGVTIYQQRNGKLVRDCSIEPSSGRTDKANIKLVFTPPEDSKSVGHYDVVIDGKIVRVQSTAGNCLFEAYAHGRKPQLTSSPQDQEEVKKYAINIREAVAENIRKNPELWSQHVYRRLEMNYMRSGKQFALLGAGYKNPTTKVLAGAFTDVYDGKKLLTVYEQVNGVKAVAIRTYDKNIAIDSTTASKPFLVPADGSDVLRLSKIKVTMNGLSFSKNKGRCQTTKAVTGQVKRPGGKGSDSEVSFHLCPSEAGANAGNEYGNAVMASPRYNKLERSVWSDDVRDYIDTNDFKLTVKVETEPIMPPGKTFKQIFDDINNERKAQKRPEIHSTNEAALKKRFEKLLEASPLAYRVTKVEFNISVAGKKPLKAIKMGRDIDLWVPDEFELPNQKYHLPGEDVDGAFSKQPYHYFNDEPTYRLQPTASATKRKEHDDDVAKEKKRHKIK